MKLKKLYGMQLTLEDMKEILRDMKDRMWGSNTNPIRAP